MQNAASPQEAAPQRAETLAAAPLRVLIADTRESSRASIKALLSELATPLDFFSADDAETTLISLRRCAIDIAFIDVGLSNGAGIAIADKARREGHTPFLILTSSAIVPDWATAATQAHAYEFLKAPFEAQDIQNAVPALQRMRNPTRILLAEPSAQSRRVIRKLAEASLFAIEIEETDNGREALKMARMQSYDLALVDSVLAGMSGLETACQLQSRCPDLAVALLVPKADTQLSAGLKHFGLKYALPKPFQTRDMDVMLHSVFHLRRPYLMNAAIQAEKRALAS